MMTAISAEESRIMRRRPSNPVGPVPEDRVVENLVAGLSRKGRRRAAAG
jgi:hypothetical protein